MATSRPEIRKPSVYKPRHPEKTPFFAVLHQYYDKFKAAYEERFQKEYGRWRDVVEEVVGKYFQGGTFFWEASGASSARSAAWRSSSL